MKKVKLYDIGTSVYYICPVCNKKVELEKISNEFVGVHYKNSHEWCPTKFDCNDCDYGCMAENRFLVKQYNALDILSERYE